MANRQIVVLDLINPNHGPNDPMLFNVCFWLVVPASRQSLVANPSFVSRVRPAPPELTALQAGQLFEQITTLSIPAGSSLAAAEAQMQSAYTAAQAQFNSTAGNQYQFYGTSFDGTTWTVVQTT